MRILVTGSRGFIGSHILAGLEQLGHEVFGLDKDNCDLADLEKLKKIIEEMQPGVIFHLAAQLPGLKVDPETFFRDNVRATFNLLESTKGLTAPRFIFASTMNVYGKPKYLPVDENHSIEPVNLYGLTKLLAENLFKFYAQNFGYKTIVFRFSGVFGPGRNSGVVASFISRALKGEIIKIDTDGSDTWDAIYVKDVVRASLKALEKIDTANYDVFNIGYGKGLMLKEVAGDIVRLTQATSGIGFGEEKSEINFYYDITKAKEAFGFTPCSFEESLRDFIAYKKSESGVVCK